MNARQVKKIRVFIERSPEKNSMTMIYILTGDFNNALKQIDFLLSIPGSFSVEILKKDPIYDPLRNLPGYKAIIQKYSNK